MSFMEYNGRASIRRNYLMYRIDYGILRSRVEDEDILKRGKELFNIGLVSRVRANGQRTYFQGEVKLEGLYEPKVKFDENGYIKITNCNCSNFNNKIGDCEHIISMFYFIDEFAREEREQQDRSKRVDSLIEYYEDLNLNIKKNINVEYTLELEVENYSIAGAYLNLRIGDDKLYIVQNIYELIKIIELDEVCDFGKHFTYNPSVYKFKEEDKKMMDLISLIYDIKSEDSINTSQRRLYLTENLLSRFFDYLGDTRVNFILGDRRFLKQSIIREFPILELDLEKKEDSFILKNTSDDMVLFLDTKKEYLFYNETFYEIPVDYRKTVYPVYKEIIVSNNKIEIEEKNRVKFISHVINNINSNIFINIDDEIQGMIYKEKLDVAIYFDKDETNVVGEVRFIYGDININPFSMNLENIHKDKILIRDMERETGILSLLEEANFKVLNGEIYLDNDENIYDLITNIIPKVQEVAEIYYSDDFKNIKIRSKESLIVNMSLNNDIDMLEFSFQLEGESKLDPDLLLKYFRTNKKFYRLEDGSFLPLNFEDKIFEEILKEDNVEFIEDKIFIPKYKGIYFNSLLNEQAHRVSDEFKEFVEDIQREVDYPVPDNLKGVLKDYQVQGFNWLKHMSSLGLGGILADDMGLGKTIQIIAYLLSEKSEADIKALIVVPTSLVYNWKEEINKFSDGKLNTLIVSGNKDERLDKIKKSDKFDVLITSYPLIKNDIDTYESIDFTHFIIDEGQNIKNSFSKNSKAVKRIKANNYFCVTGTPMENSLSELWSLFDFLMPGYLYSRRRFMEEYEKPIYKFDDEASLENLNEKIKPFILRRLKNEVLKELPDKMENNILVDMVDEQKALYVEYVEYVKEDLKNSLDENKSRNQFKILAGLTRLRQISCHPKLFVEEYTGKSGKLEKLIEIIHKSVEDGDRILLFSQFTKMLDIIADRFEEEGIDYLYLSGSTPMDKRLDLTDEFNKGNKRVFLISLKAGGSGLNLVGANKVIHFDPWWNPAVEDQATDRAYRIGQEKDVEVIKLISEGTIEEKIVSIQDKKQKLIDQVVKEGENFLSKLSREEIISLFK